MVNKTSLEAHRRAAGTDIETILLKPPFSSFDFIEQLFGNHYNSIRRIFSLARSFDATILISEKLLPLGIIAEENSEIKKLFPSYKNTNLIRLSFWKTKKSDNFTSDNLRGEFIGYAILKKDSIPDENLNEWHVFEAVFSKYPHPHNCVPRPQKYLLTINNREILIRGLLYCQQNQLNKACAQVALRSLLSRVLPEKDISYSSINKIAYEIHEFEPKNGLSVQQIRGILTKLGIKYTDIDYTQPRGEILRKEFPYQKYTYAGLEGGDGALIGFRLAGRALKDEAKHIIPIYGHTFNKDTWAPDADISYFRIGEGFGYIPSESWTSSLLGHDDNFGPNFCIPRLYIGNDKVDYVVEIFRPGVCFSGVYAEAIALDILYSLLPKLSANDNKWIKRLVYWTEQQGVVFRAQALTSQEYVDHLSSLVGWESDKESDKICHFLAANLPPYIWVIEISTPQLFPANERKIGEIIIDATRPLPDAEGSLYDVFVFARLPGTYYLGGDVEDGEPSLNLVPSGIISHTELIRLP